MPVSYTHLDVYKRQAAKKPAPITGIRKRTIFREGDAAQQVNDLVAALQKDGHDFSVGIPMDTPIPKAERCLLYTSRCV